ncbi:MAG TPA: DUF1800 domain-containing protein [Rhodopila sp.]|uniref:DUF1800 domain-containing protein n=1 Tax=Rhodopila sp. TaxID=2480087 RepID=UPI002BA31000|nr:DUF1800 domain-containing protein [Rhodopila sp.]HVY17087.1 DUF1800 domain-containing protein [Rhodopila sp.]
MDLRTAHALVRFGLGRRPSEPLPADPSAWLTAQLQGVDRPAFDPPPTAAAGLAAIRDDRLNKPPPGESEAQALFRAQSAAQMANAVTTRTPFRERLVWFWTNHFTVSRKRGEIAPLAAAFVEEAIRPNVTGRFEDMVLAVMHHPAMLLYLDNAGSVGPDSRAGERSHRGLNENLARECMELHTVSPLAGYTQADVTSFAKILTGWSIERRKEPLGFRYRPFAHEPGVQTLMGRTFPPDEQGGVQALRFLANHPATHRFLATKLVRYFVADDPPPAAVSRIETVLRNTGGDLHAASIELVRLDAAWQPGTKLRTPAELVVAAVRCLEVPPDKVPIVGIMGGLGQPLWAAPAPNGWTDRASEWAAPEAMMRRIDWSSGFAGRVGQRDVVQLADDTLGPLLQADTAEAIRRAGSRKDAMTLLLTSPEFQRR